MKLNSKSKIKRRPNPAWSIFNKINMTQFFLKTYVPFGISKCLLYNMDCTKFWKPRLTYIGNCFQLSPNDVIDVSATKHLPHGVYMWGKPTDSKRVIRIQTYFGYKILTKIQKLYEPDFWSRANAYLIFFNKLYRALSLK